MIKPGVKLIDLAEAIEDSNRKLIKENGNYQDHLLLLFLLLNHFIQSFHPLDYPQPIDIYLSPSDTNHNNNNNIKLVMSRLESWSWISYWIISQ